MEADKAIEILAALAQPTRLAAFRLLVAHAPDGLAAGDVARHLAVPANTLSAHLGVLSAAGLVGSTRRGRVIVYRAELACLAALTDFLIRDCCGGHPDLCAAVAGGLTARLNNHTPGGDCCR